MLTPIAPTILQNRSEKSASIKKAKGFSLVELLIAISLSVLVSAALLSVYTSGRQTLQVNQAQTFILEEIRSLTNILGRSIEHSGFRNQSNITESLETVFPDVGDFNSGQVINVKTFTSASGTSNESGWEISNRFQGSGDGLASDCLGKVHSSDSLITQVIRFSKNDNNEGQLNCSVSCRNINKLSEATCQPLNANISNKIEQFEGLIGIDTDQDSIINRYIPIEQFNADKEDILAIKISALLRSEINAYSKDTVYDYQNLSGSISFNDKKLRSPYSQTFTLRNQLP